MSLLFLNNNLHLVHHDKPGLPWYRIPAFYRQRRDLFLASNGGYHFKGYREVFRRHFLRAKEAPLHPAATPPSQKPSCSGLTRAPKATAPSRALDTRLGGRGRRYVLASRRRVLQN